MPTHNHNDETTRENRKAKRLPAAPKPTNKIDRGIDHLDFDIEKLDIVVVTPSTAQVWYDNDADWCSDYDKKSAQRIATDIKAGDWKFTGDPIKFDLNGKLVDGRARLAAIIKANIPVRTVVATGIVRRARDGIGTGKVHKAKDMLAEDGYDNADRLAPALTAIQEWELGHHTLHPSESAITNSTTRRFLADNPKVKDLANEAARLVTGADVTHGALTLKQAAKLLWAFDKVNHADRVAFFNKVLTGSDLTENDPVLHLRNTYIRQAKAKVKGSGIEPATNRVILAVTIKAFNAFRAGRDVKVLSFVGGGSKPEEFPLPK